jgi:TPR repeat protein
MKWLCGLVLALLLAASPAYADFDEAVAAYHRGDYATALREFRPLAEQGDADAQYNLGLMYANGHGVPQDHVEAAMWFRPLAELGDAGAQFALGFMYANGHGVPQDHVEAATWYRAAAEQGEAHAQASLGVMYRYGKGVLLDLVLAHMWFNLSAVRGDPVSVELRDQTAKIMTREQIAEAQQLAHEWKPTK